MEGLGGKKRTACKKKKNNDEEEWELKCGWMDGRDDERAAVTGKRGWFVQSRGSHAEEAMQSVHAKLLGSR